MPLMTKNNEKLIRKRIAVVTGAGSGIGKAVALALIKEGLHVYLIGRDKEKLNNTKKQAIHEKCNGGCSIFKCDVSAEKEVRKLFLIIKKNHNRVDVLFNNAGIGMQEKTIDKINFKEWKKVIDTNINGMFLCAKFSYEMMKIQKPKGGRIINNGSISALTPRPKSVAYTTSKHAITGLTKALSLDGREDKIVCSQIDIGNALTPLTKKFTKGITQANGKKTPEATMNSKNVAELVLFIIRLPLDTNVFNSIIMANNMPFIGRG